MRHAGELALAQLQPLIEKIRGAGGLVEKKPGIFYRKGRAYLHFHEDAAGLFADVKLDGQRFSRWRVSTHEEQDAFWSALGL